MKKYFITALSAALLINLSSCGNNEKENPQQAPKTDNTASPDKNSSIKNPNLNNVDVTQYIPEGYKLVETYKDDFNKDNSVDQVLLVKNTLPSAIVKDDSNNDVDRNRRGLIILLSNKNNSYDVAIKNLDCFSSENEDGGLYFAPELNIEAKKGLLYISYGHGKYGSWSYTFRHQNADFELIGYDHEEARGPLVISTTSINFSTNKEITKEIVDENVEEGKEKYTEKTRTIAKKPLHKLSQIKDFDELIVN